MEISIQQQAIHAVLDSAPIVVCEVDAAGNMAYVNHQFEEVTGYHRDEVLGRSWFDLGLLSMESIAALMQRHQEKLAGRTPSGMEMQLKRKDGSWVWVAGVGEMRYVHDQPSGVRLFAQDISEQKRYAEDLLKARKLESMGLLASGIAHDFNNLLTALAGSMALARHNLPADSPALPHLDSAQQTYHRASGLTRQLLSLAHDRRRQRQVCDLKCCIEEASHLALPSAKVHVVMDLASDLRPVLCDRQQLLQVFSNLVRNALESQESRGEIHIQAENLVAEGEQVEIRVLDRGCGIPAEREESIYDPFFTTKPEGTGLGLASAYSIVAKHDGELGHQPREGGGTIFFVRLPASDGQVAQEAEAKPALCRGRRRILLMDDEEMVRRVATEMLCHLGYEVDCVCDGEETLEAYRRCRDSRAPYDALILDMKVKSGMGGRETIAEIRKEDRKVKAIMSSGYFQELEGLDPVELGFQATLPKPYAVEELGRVLGEVLAEN